MPPLSFVKRTGSIATQRSRGDKVSADAIRLAGTVRAALGEEDRLILIVGACRGEGVTTITGQLGSALASMTRERVLVADTNLRHPSLHESFEFKQAPGLADFVRATISFDEAIRGTAIPTLFVLPAGETAGAPVETILQHERYVQLLQLARQQFRYVLLDAAPMLGFADWVVAAGEADGAILVLRALERTKGEAAEMTRLLRNLGTEAVGAVISQA